MMLYAKRLQVDSQGLISWLYYHGSSDFKVVRIELEHCPTFGPVYVVTYLNNWEIL